VVGRERAEVVLQAQGGAAEQCMTLVVGDVDEESTVPSAICLVHCTDEPSGSLALVVPPKASFWLLSTPGILVASVVLKDEV